MILKRIPLLRAGMYNVFIYLDIYEKYFQHILITITVSSQNGVITNGVIKHLL